MAVRVKALRLRLLMRPKPARPHTISNAQKTVLSRLWFDNGTRSGTIRKVEAIKPQALAVRDRSPCPGWSAKGRDAPSWLDGEPV